MKVSIVSDMAVRYEGERYYKGDELVIKKEHFNAAIMKEVEEEKAAPKKTSSTKVKKETE